MSPSLVDHDGDVRISHLPPCVCALCVPLHRVCDLVLDAAEAELVVQQAAAAGPDTPLAVPVWLQLMDLFGRDTPMLVRGG